MLRHLAIAAMLCVSPCFAEPTADDAAGESASRHDPFVISTDECGASRYTHLVGQGLAMHRASMPADTVVHGLFADGAINPVNAEQAPAPLATLEYRPYRLNVVVDASARIISVGCH